MRARVIRRCAGAKPAFAALVTLRKGDELFHAGQSAVRHGAYHVILRKL